MGSSQSGAPLFALMRIEGRAKSRASDATPEILPTLNLTNPAQGASSGFPLEFTARKRRRE